MKNIFTSLFLLFCSLGLTAQIVYDMDDLGVPGETYSFITDTLPNALVPGAMGENVTWDFTNLNVHSIDEITYELPSNTLYGAAFPTSDLAVDFGGGAYFYTEVETAFANTLGFGGDVFGLGFPLIVQYSDPQRLFEFPMSYNTTFTDSYSFSVTIDAALVGIPQVDSVRLDRSGSITVTVDGWGMATTPFGTYSTMRTHIVDTYTDDILGYTAGTWIPFQSDTGVEERYEWLAEESKGGALVSMSINPDTGDVLNIEYANLNTTVAAPAALFSYVDNGGNIDFTDESTNSPNIYEWDFGNGDGSSEANPNYTYPESGTYNVCLTVTNVGGTDTYCEMITVEAAPISAFTYVNGTSEGELVFTDNSANSPTTWSWDFGDDGTSTDQNPTHTYGAPGIFNVCLTVTNAAGSDTQCELVEIVFAPTASFSVMEGANPGEMVFTDLSSNSPTSWTWLFADGGTSSDQNPVHTFATDGVYNVCMTASNSVGSDTYCMDVTVVTTSLFNTSKDGITLEMFPNPANEFVQINIEENAGGDYQLLIFDALGRKIGDQTYLQNGNNTISLNDLALGNYYFHIQNMNTKKSTVRKIIVK